MNIFDVIEVPQETQHFFGCGFAAVTAKVRKNSATAKALEVYGFEWSDYFKNYILSVNKTKPANPFESQNLSLKLSLAHEAISTFRVMPEFKDVDFNVWSRED